MSKKLLYADDLLKPPPQADEQKSVILKKLRRLAFEIMPDKLEYPPNDKKPERNPPKSRNKKAHRDEQ